MFFFFKVKEAYEMRISDWRSDVFSSDPTGAAANANEKTKTIKRIVRDHLDGTNGRQQIIDWVPRWMTFPPTSYTARGGVGTVAAHAKAEAAREIERV